MTNFNQLYRDCHEFEKLAEGLLSTPISLQEAKKFSGWFRGNILDISNQYKYYQIDKNKTSSNGIIKSRNNWIIDYLKQALSNLGSILINMNNFNDNDNKNDNVSFELAGTSLQNSGNILYNSDYLEQFYTTEEAEEILRKISDLATQLYSRVISGPGNLKKLLDDVANEEPDPIISLNRFVEVLEDIFQYLEKILSLIGIEKDFSPILDLVSQEVAKNELLYRASPEEEDEMIRDLLDPEDLENPEAIEAVRQGRYF